MSKTKVGTYRPSNGIFIESGDIYVDDKDRIFIKAKYKEFSQFTGFIKAPVRNRLIRFNREDESFTYKGQTFYVWNQDQIISWLIYHGHHTKLQNTYS